MADSRNTVQKSRILEYLRSVKSHPSADMVYDALKKDISSLSLGTVYRNLNFLAAQGKILKFEINNEARYDGDICNHQHCICLNCGRIIDCMQEEISQYSLKKIKVNNFKPVCVTIIYKGICSDCKIP
jgi:Fe2+ or Zn2+ uptake regulation protein